MVDTTKISTSSTATKEAIKTIAGDEIDDRGIENNAAADQSDAEIKTAYENNANTNAYTDAEKTKTSWTRKVFATNSPGASSGLERDWGAGSPTSVKSVSRA